MKEALTKNEALAPGSLIQRDLGRLSIISRNGLSERNRFVKKFDWIPHWKAEVTVALRGLPIQLKIIEGMPEPGPAAGQTYENVLKYWDEAHLSMYQLEQAIPKEGEKAPSPDLIRQNFYTREAMARFGLAHAQMDSYSWHPRARNRRQRIQNQLNDGRLLSSTMELAGASDDRLYAQWFLARVSEGKRFDFWHNELVKVQSNPLVMEHQARNRQKPREMVG